MVKRIMTGMWIMMAALAMVCIQAYAQSTAQEAGQEAGQAAQQAGQTAEQAGQEAGNAASETMGVSPQVQEKLQRLSTELGLTSDQKAKIKPILQDEVKQLRSVKDDSSMNADQKEAKAKQIHESSSAQIQSFLTPEQQTKLEQMKEKAMQK